MIDENCENQTLSEIRDILQKIFICFEEQYIEILERKKEEKLLRLNEILSDKRKKIFPLLFDENNYSQTEIAEKTGVTQQAISVFIKLLIENEIIEQNQKNGISHYVDKYHLSEQFES